MDVVNTEDIVNIVHTVDAPYTVYIVDNSHRAHVPEDPIWA